MWSAQISVDDTKYQERLSNNGGCYSFNVTRHFFYRKHNSEFKFAFIDQCDTSAEFQYSWDGHFCNNGTYVEFINGPTNFIPYFSFQEYENGESVITDCMEKYLCYIKFNEIFKTQFVYESADERENYSELAINVENQTLILDKLKAEGFSPKIKNRL